jgi:hypothetical protein
MATLAIQAGSLVLAVGLGWVGVQGLRGVPESNGKVTSKATAVACLVLAALLAAWAAAAPYVMWGP